MMERIKEIVADSLGVDVDSLTAETRFKEDLEADSLDLFEMVMAIEEEFDVKIETEELENIKTLGDIEKEVERLHKEEEKLNKELARVKGMLSNERFVSKAPESKVAEEKAKLEKYTNMMEQVKERLKQLEK